LVSPFSVGFTAPEEGDAIVVAALQNSGRDSLDYIALRLEKFNISRRLRNVKVKALTDGVCLVTGSLDRVHCPKGRQPWPSATALAWAMGKTSKGGRGVGRKIGSM
jgi:hypothetical protein